jgi:hypothetical protein
MSFLLKLFKVSIRKSYSFFLIKFLHSEKNLEECKYCEDLETLFGYLSVENFSSFSSMKFSLALFSGEKFLENVLNKYI